MNKLFFAVISGVVFLGHAAPCLAQQSRTYQVKPLSTVQPTYMDSSMSQSAGGGAAMQRYGLPKTIHGPAVGQPGDPVSKGDFQGNTRRAVTTSGQQQTIGLPACRSSAYVDGYGDHIRSDMHRRIDGTDARQPRVMLRPVQQQQQRPQQQTAVYRYGDALQPAYKRGNSY